MKVTIIIATISDSIVGVATITVVVGKLVAILNINSRDKFFFSLLKKCLLLCGTAIVAITRVGKLVATIGVVRKTFFFFLQKNHVFLEIATMGKLVLIIVVIGRGGTKRSSYYIERGNGRCINSCVGEGTNDRNDNNCYYSKDKKL